MVDEQDIDGWVETDGDVEYDIGGVMERDSEAAPAGVAPTSIFNGPFVGPFGGPI